MRFALSPNQKLNQLHNTLDEAVNRGIIERFREGDEQYFAVWDTMTNECVATVIKLNNVQFAITEVVRHFDHPDMRVAFLSERTI